MRKEKYTISKILPKVTFILRFVRKVYRKLSKILMIPPKSLPEAVLFHLNRDMMNESISIGPEVLEYFVEFSEKNHEIYLSKTKG